MTYGKVGRRGGEGGRPQGGVPSHGIPGKRTLTQDLVVGAGARAGVSAPGAAALPLQHKVAGGGAASAAAASPRNDTGMPDTLKAGVESLSGMRMDDVRVHYNSPDPARYHALAYAQGAEIHVGPGQEAHLPHEAWHVVQQKQGRVPSTTQMKGKHVNDDPGLEREADVMGGMAASAPAGQAAQAQDVATPQAAPAQLRGVTLDVVKQAVGTGFCPTSGGSQETSDDAPVTGLPEVIFHFTVPVLGPDAIHISYYPAVDKEYKSKIMHVGFRWKSDTESFGPPAQQLETWKPYKQHLGGLLGHANAEILKLATSIKRVLDQPTAPTSSNQAPSGNSTELDYIPVPDVGGPQVEHTGRYYDNNRPFPQTDDHENGTMFFKAAEPGGGAPLQRRLEIAHDDTSNEHLDLDSALTSVFFQPPESIAAAIKEMREHESIAVRVGFSDHVDSDDFACTAVHQDKKEINVHVSTALLVTDVDEGSDGEVEAEVEAEQTDNVTRETELQATIIHEFILHTIPAFNKLKNNNQEQTTEAEDHGDIDAWHDVLKTAATVNPFVLLNSIVDALKHFDDIPKARRKELTGYIQKIVESSSKDINMDVDGGDLYIFNSAECAHFTAAGDSFEFKALYETSEYLENRDSK